MPDGVRQGELDFPAARDQIEREIESYLRGAGGESLEIPSIRLEKGEFHFSFRPTSMEPARILEALQAIKSHVEQVRVHSFEPGYQVFQSMGGASPSAGSYLNEIKYKFISIGSSAKLEVTRKGNLTQDEVQSCIHLFKVFHPLSGSTSPARRLSAMGVNLYLPETDTTDHPGAHSQSGPGESSALSSVQEERSPGRTDFIAGYEKTRLEVEECIVLPLKHPDLFLDVARMARGSGAGNMPRAILFEGPPGVGKTTMARIIARETGIPMVYVPVENILSKYYGESAQNMAAIFDAAAELPRVILFLDEIDSLAGSREDGMFEATRRVLSVLLRKIDGFDTRDGILTIGATNRTGDLDRALLSRFDHIISFPLPDPQERIAIFSHFARHLPPEALEQLSRASEGASGRTIQDLCEYAERRWARQLIARGDSASPPPPDLYLEIVREKRGFATPF